jgi:hypothetical protein
MKDNFCQGASPPRATPSGTRAGAAVLRARGVPLGASHPRCARSFGWLAQTALLLHTSYLPTRPPTNRANAHTLTKGI